MRNVRHLIARIAPTEMPVLITGETGTGKEEVARLIHHQSRRSATLFTAINSAALPADLIESELFGHERGAFTGATVQRIGKLEAADGSTLLLDEIGEMPLTLQAKLLRFLQEQEIQRVGSNRTIKLNVRIIAATNRNLTEEISAGRFRNDLYYRLQACRVTIAPLRERREDIRQLVLYFVKRIAAGHTPPSFTEDALQLLEKHEWRGNVRELASAVEYAVHLRAGDVIGIDDLPDNVRAETSEREGKSGKHQPGDSQSTRLRIPPLDRRKQWSSGVNRIRSERLAIVRQTIHECGGNKAQAARELGISRQRLHEILKEGESG